MSKVLDKLELRCLRLVAREVELLLSATGNEERAKLKTLVSPMNAWSVIQAQQIGDPNPKQEDDMDINERADASANRKREVIRDIQDTMAVLSPSETADVIAELRTLLNPRTLELSYDECAHLASILLHEREVMQTPVEGQPRRTLDIPGQIPKIDALIRKLHSVFPEQNWARFLA